ncbi:MAG: hypothetical protein Q9174_006370 [Haloplaca sp. 1 TL-2023]
MDSRDTPPPLHFSPVTSEQERSSTAETTPIGTPKTFDHTFRRRSDKERERDLLTSHYRKATPFAASGSSYVDSALLESDLEDYTFPLFPDTSDTDMDLHSGSTTTAIPPHNTQATTRIPFRSNLTSALQSTSANETRPTPAMSTSNGKGSSSGLPRRDSLTAPGSYYGSGAQPISMTNGPRERPRRESLAGSMVSGMSWGGVSVGSFVRDEIINQGSSPFPAQSPSFHSSSYIPKLEANFMRDFRCCGTDLPTFHDLTTHWEENHDMTAMLPHRNNTNPSATLPDSKAAVASKTAKAVQQSAAQQSAQQAQPTRTDQTQAAPQVASNPVTPKVPKAEPVQMNDYQTSQHHPSLDMDAVQDMEMDDVDYNPRPQSPETNNWGFQNQSRMMARPQFGQSAAPKVPPLDTNALNMGNHFQQHQGLRTSTPTTPINSSRGGNYYQNNPTVSSVNTPTLTAYPVQRQRQYMGTPVSSNPGTPGEPADDYVANMASTNDPMDMGNDYGYPQNQFGNYGNFHAGNGHEMLELCIADPAKRLYTPNGAFNGNQPQISNAARLGDAQYSENSELAATIRREQRNAGIPDGGSGPNDGVPKPFHCPVIGCEKAYKNQNGLKYHKAHGHNTQQLHDNDNGTFSIIDPETSNPYPGTLGMQKHKPYKCTACGKRYKNLNGLKYHKNHSAACEDGKPLTEAMDTTTTSTAQPTQLPPANNPTNFSHAGFNNQGNGNMNGMPIVLGASGANNGYSLAGLPGIDEEMIM